MIPGNVYISGITAVTDDLNAQLRQTLPIFIGAVVGAVLVLLIWSMISGRRDTRTSL